MLRYDDKPPIEFGFNHYGQTLPDEIREGIERLLFNVTAECDYKENNDCQGHGKIIPKRE